MKISPPPRTISAQLSVRVLFGGFLSQFGWLFCAFGMVFVLAFDLGGSLGEWWAFRGGFETAEGVVTGWTSTNMSINDVTVYETGFEYDHPEAGLVAGASYATGSWTESGKPVTVEFVPSDPSLSRIAGMRRSEGGAGVLFIFIFPAVGLILATLGLRKGLRTLRLLQVGHVTRGRLLTSETTNSRINNQPVMRMTFEFDVEGGGTHQAVAHTHQPHRLEDEERELLVYDPRDPSAASMLDELPCQPRFDEAGELEASRPGLPSALYLLLPGLSALAALRFFSSLL